MPKLPFFAAACPSCSKNNHLEIRWLGRRTKCNFCGKHFEAKGPDSSSAALDDPLHYWINFTDHSILDADEYAFEQKDIARTPR